MYLLIGFYLLVLFLPDSSYSYVQQTKKVKKGKERNDTCIAPQVATAAAVALYVTG